MPASASAIAVVAAGAVVLWWHDLGPQSAHMALHIAAMNVAAPLAAVMLAPRIPAARHATAILWAGTAVQIMLLWIWHAPALQRSTMASPHLQALMHGSLLVAAVLFWWALLRLSTATRWHAIPALLLTGKFACLLGVLLTFAPRRLYELAPPPADFHHLPASTALADQQLAGLLMIIACPTSYVIAGVVFAAQLVGEPRRSPAGVVIRTFSRVEP